MATFYLDPVGGNDANDGTSFANRWKTFTTGATAARIAGGDTIRVMASPVPTSIGSATWTKSNASVTLAGALTKNVDLCEAAWTASANVTTSTSTNRKQGNNSTTMAIAAGFTTGLVAYKALGATEDFSGYKQISLWYMASAVLAANVLSLKLCSDVAGATPVDTIQLPAANFANVWNVVTVDLGAALGSSIQSVALYADSDPGAVTVQLDNIITCKDSTSADSLTLASLISKKNGEGWYAVQSINGTAVGLETAYNGVAGSSKSYFGTTATVETFKREAFMFEGPVGATTTLCAINDDGTNTAQIVYSGGWNRTDMSTQLTGEDCYSFFQSRNGLGNMFLADSKKFNTFENLVAARCWVAFSLAGTAQGMRLSNCGAIATGALGISSAVKGGLNVTDFYSNNGAADGINHQLGPAKFKNIKVHGATGANSIIIQNCTGIVGENFTCKGGSTYGLVLSNCNSVIYGLTTELNTTSGIYNGGHENVIINASIAEATEVTDGLTLVDGFIHSHNHDLTPDNHVNFVYGGRITSHTGATRHTASGMSWALSPTNADRNSEYPLKLTAPQVGVAANAEVTVKAFVNRSNTGITAKMLVRGGQIAGVSTDQVATASAGAGSWEELTLTFTPTEAGAVEVEFQAYGGTTYTAYFDDMTISQA
jgi:hypothetical protein